MATTTNFGWTTPNDTDLVKDGAAAIRTLGSAIDTSMADLKGGTTGQYLTKQTNTDMDFQWVTPVIGDITAVNAGTGISGGGTSGDVTITNSMATAIDAKGDLILGTANDTFSRKAVGSNGTVLVADSTDATGVIWSGSLTGLTTITTSSPAIINSVKIGRGAFDSVNTTAVGTDALKSMNGGGSNTAVGYASLTALTSAGSVTALGINSGVAITTGDSNTVIGASAGNTITTGTNNTCLGNGAQAATATTNNTITLGNSSIATLRCQVTSITALSDARDKTDILPLDQGLDLVNNLNPVKFTWDMRDGGKVGIKDVGFIAQEIIALEDATGEADYLQLSYRDNPDQLEITQGRLIPILVKAIQELSAKVAELEAAK